MVTLWRISEFGIAALRAMRLRLTQTLSCASIASAIRAVVTEPKKAGPRRRERQQKLLLAQEPTFVAFASAIFREAIL